MKKILFVTPSFSRGGAEKNMLNVINSLDSNIIDIFLIVINKELDYAKYLGEHVKIISLGRKSVFASYFQVFTLVKKIRPSLVFSSAENVSILVLLVKLLMFNKFQVVTRIPTLPSNNLENTYKGNYSKLGKAKLLKKVLFFLRFSNRIIAQTTEMKEEVNKYYKIPLKKIIVIPNLVNENQIQELSKETNPFKENEKFVVLAIGTLYSIKGFDYLIRGFGDFLDQRENKEDFHLYILGMEGNELGYRNYLQTIVQELDLLANVHFEGHVTNPYKYIKNSNVFVLSSLKEGFPNVVLEAMVLRCFVIVTDCVDFTKIVKEGVNGEIIAKADSGAISDSLNRNIKRKNDTSTKIVNFEFTSWFIKMLR